MWIVTEEYNAYYQYGEYFVAAYIGKPSFVQLKDLIGASDTIVGKLTRGGGRQQTENHWYYLREVEIGQRLD